MGNLLGLDPKCQLRQIKTEKLTSFCNIPVITGYWKKFQYGFII